MNLLYTLTSYPPATGGAQLLQHHTALHLGDRHSIQVVTHWDSNRTDWLLGTTLCAPSQPRDYLIDGVPVHRLGLSRRRRLGLIPAVALYYPLMELALRPICGQLDTELEPYALGTDLIHNVRIGREGLSPASLQAARAWEVPFVLTPVHHPRLKGWFYRVYLSIYRSADLVIALTEAEKQTLVALGVSEGRIRVTGFGPILAEKAHPDEFLSRYRIRGPMILFLGQHYICKGYRQVLEAASLVWKRFPDACFAFLGRAVGNSDGPFEEFQDRRILRLGEVDLKDKTDALAASAVLCVPSTQESFGGIYTEAWSFGKPVIGCDIPAVSEVITDGLDGILVSQDAKQIADAICQLLQSPGDAQIMGEAGKRKVHERYNWKRLAILTEEAYLKVMGSTWRNPPDTREMQD